MGAPEVSLLKLFQGPVIRKASVYAHVVQESIMPIRYLSEGMKRFDSWYGVYPLLVFPLRVYDRGELSGFLHPKKENLIPGKDYGIWVDLGAYGAPRDVKEGKVWDAKKSIREMEHWTRDIGGWQAYYTDIMCTQKEFREMYDHTLVDKCRKRLNATDAFPEVSRVIVLVPLALTHSTPLLSLPRLVSVTLFRSMRRSNQSKGLLISLLSSRQSRRPANQQNLVDLQTNGSRLWSPVSNQRVLLPPRRRRARVDTS
jgi:hypothetical protein